MTYLQALQSTISYPVNANAFERLLADRGLNAADVYAGKSKAFDLAKADLYVELITAANVSEGGYSISISERSNFLTLANAIYAQYGEVIVTIAQPTVKGVSVW